MAVAMLFVGCATTRRAPEPSPRPAERSAYRPRGRSLADVLARLEPTAERRLRARFAAAGAAYPPENASMLVFKAEREVELWAKDGEREVRIADYPMTADSGTVGPKLEEGDEQIPEGIYRVIWLHPNSHYHLSMKLDYPNAFDRARGREDGRTNLGGDIFVHGDHVSIGCVAVGDSAIEELFVLAARVGIGHVRVILSPWDLRRLPPPPRRESDPGWLRDLYSSLKAALADYS